MKIWLLLVLSLFVQTTYAAGNEYSTATSHGKPNFQVMGCPAGSFWDPINGGQCWSCPGGVRGVDRVDSKTACLVPPKPVFARARLIEDNKNRCTGDSFLDVGTGACWSCRDGYDRTVFPVTGDSACETPVAKQNRTAIYDYTTKGLRPCKSGTFANVGSNRCHRCPKGYKHDALKKVDTSGVCFKPATVDRIRATKVKTIKLTCDTGFYDPIDGGSCWSCPAGFERQVTSVKSDSACIKVSAPRAEPAKLISNLGPDPRRVARGASDLGCGQYGPNAFFDPINLGSCWSCASSHPVRSLYAVDSGKACMTNQCGKEGGRPCLMWERIPSCDEGLVEDFAKNQCRRSTNLACKAYVNTLAKMIDVVEKANEAGQALSESALEQIPGHEEMLRALERKVTELQAAAENATKNLPVDEVMQPFRELVDQSPELMTRFVKVAKIAQENRSEVIRIMTDPELICKGNLERMVWHLNNLGIGDVLHPAPSFNISIGEVGQPVDYSRLLASASPQPIMMAQADRGLLKHHRITWDLGVTIPLSNSPMNLGLGVQLATDHMRDGYHAFYFMHSLTAKAEAAPPDDWTDAGPLAKALGATGVSVGFQYNGPTPNSCPGNPTYSWGVPVKPTGWLGIGVRLSCPPYYFGGFTVNLPGVKYGHSGLPEPTGNPLEQAEQILAPGPAAGSTLTDTPTATNRAKIALPTIKSFGAGYEGGLTIWSTSGGWWTTDSGAGVY